MPRAKTEKATPLASLKAKLDAIDAELKAPESEDHAENLRRILALCSQHAEVLVWYNELGTTMNQAKATAKALEDLSKRIQLAPVGK